MLKIARDKAKKSSAVETIDIDVDDERKDTENNDNNGDNKRMNATSVLSESRELIDDFVCV